MSSEPPSYSSIAERDPPKYSDAVANIYHFPPSPPYTDSSGSLVIMNLPSLTIPPAPMLLNPLNWFVQNRYKLIWISFLILLSILHIILSIISFNCSLPKTSFNAIRAFLFLHLIFIGIEIIYCRRKYKSKSALSFESCCIAALACAGIPVVINLFIFIALTIDDMNKLKNAIQSPISTTDTYSCSLAFYQLLFGVMIFNYIAAPAFIIILLILFICLKVC